MLLLVEEQTGLGDVPVQVDRQLRDPEHGAVGAEQPVRHAVTVPEGDPAGHSQVPVEPGVEQRAAVDLHRQLAEAGQAPVGPGPDAQVGRVRVGPGDAERAARIRCRGRRPAPRDQRAVPDHEPGAGRLVHGPVRGRVDLREARSQQHPPCGVHGVERGGGGVDELDQCVCRVGHVSPSSSSDRWQRAGAVGVGAVGVASEAGAVTPLVHGGQRRGLRRAGEGHRQRVADHRRLPLVAVDAPSRCRDHQHAAGRALGGVGLEDEVAQAVGHQLLAQVARALDPVGVAADHDVGARGGQGPGQVLLAGVGAGLLLGPVVQEHHQGVHPVAGGADLRQQALLVGLLRTGDAGLARARGPGGRAAGRRRCRWRRSPRSAGPSPP